MFNSGKPSMKAYDELWGVAEDHYGIITASQAGRLGVSRQSLSAMVHGGRLVRLCHGVYQVRHHVPSENDTYAASVAAVGEDAYLRGASVLYMLGLTPANPSVVYVGTAKRARRCLPKGFRLKVNAPCDAVEFDGYEGIRCQPLVDALMAARDDGAIEADRIAEAAIAANEKGLLTDGECAQFQN